MKIDKITQLHAELLQGINIEELSDKSLLKYGSLLLKQHRQAKSVLRKIEAEQVAKTNHWILVREHCSAEIDSVLTELDNRMLADPETFSDNILLQFADLVGSIRVAIFDEEQLDNSDQPAVDEQVNLIFDE